MAGASIPPEVERFLIAHVPSVAVLEALLLLRGDTAHSLSVNALPGRLYIDARLARAIVEHLVSHGLATQSETGALRYAAAGPLATAVDLVAEIYPTRLVAVSQFIHARQDSVGIRNFADAFRFRKD